MFITPRASCFFKEIIFNSPNLESPFMILPQPQPPTLKCRYAINFNALNEAQYQIPWAPNI